MQKKCNKLLEKHFKFTNQRWPFINITGMLRQAEYLTKKKKKRNSFSFLFFQLSVISLQSHIDWIVCAASISEQFTGFDSRSCCFLLFTAVISAWPQITLVTLIWRLFISYEIKICETQITCYLSCQGFILRSFRNEKWHSCHHFGHTLKKKKVMYNFMQFCKMSYLKTILGMMLS